MTISEKALADLLLKYFTTLEPVGKNVTLKNEMKKVAQPDGSTKAQMVPKKGDAYIPKDLSNAMAKAIAKAIHPQLPGGFKVYRKSTSTVTATGTISPWAPTFISALQVTIKADEGDFAQVHVGTHDLEQSAAVIAQMYLGFTLDGTAQGNDVKSVHAYATHGQVDFPASLTWTIGPLSAGTHIIRPYTAKYQAADNNFSCRWPFCHILVFPGTEVQG
jgi:hypothetical protein